jgi:hypothetical protein
MAKDNRTNKRCFESRYDGGWISGSQRLAEMACERIAGETTLGAKFWNQKPWTSVFRREVTHANRLLATPFAIEAIIKAWVSRDGRRVRTLGAPFFVSMIQIEQRKLDLENKNLDTSVTPQSMNTLETPRPFQRENRSIREKLEENGKT